jgi:hypothetical protein
MPEQQEFYNQLRQETESKVQTYKDFQTQIEKIKADTKERIEKLKADIKVIAKQIEVNNNILKDRGQEIVKFE